jgi:hypothetical protein
LAKAGGVITTNDEWDAKNIALAKKPIYVFTIGGESTVYTTHQLAAEGITGTLPSHQAWLKVPRGASQSIDVLSGRSSIGELEFEVIDPVGDMRELVGGTTLEGRSATLSVGYPEIAYTNFVILHTYQICKITPTRGYTSWNFQARDVQMAQKRTVWDHPENGEPISADNPWIVLGTPAEIVQAIHLFALGRSVDEIDRTGLMALDSGAEGLFKSFRPYLFKLTESFEAKQFLETEIYKTAGLYPVITNMGKLSFRASRPPAAAPETVFTFDADNMIVLPEIDRMPVINEIVFKLDHNGDDFGTELFYIDATSVSAYGRAGQHTIESKGLWTVFGAQWICQDVAYRLFRRFAGTPAGLRGGAPVIRIEAFLLTLPVWVGDYVCVTHAMMPDLLTGDLGVTDRLYEVIDREPDFARGRMRYRLLDTGLTGVQPAHKLASSDRDFIIGTSEIY